MRFKIVFLYYLKRMLHSSGLLQGFLKVFLLLPDSILHKKQNNVIYKRIPFKRNDVLPEINLKVMIGYKSNSYYYNGRSYNLIDFENKEVQQWNIQNPKILDGIKAFNRCVAVKKAKYLPLSSYFIGIGSEHTVHMSKDKKFICSTYGYFCNIVDVIKNEAYIFPGDYLDRVMIYCETGGFSPDGEYWFTIRWPLEDNIDVLNNKKNSVRCEIVRLNLKNRQSEVVGNIEYKDRIHQISCSPDGKYLIIIAFQQDLHIPFPKRSIYTDPDGYKRSNSKGLKCGSIVTYEIGTGHYWYTDIPTPAPAHAEFDIYSPDVFYLSAHNIKHYQSTLFIEGPGAIYKMRISNNDTVIEASYSDPEFLRITQHELFYNDRNCYAAVITSPDKLDIINCRTMSLEKRIRVSVTDPIDFSRTGNAIAPDGKNIYSSVNPSYDGKYMLLGSGGDLKLYDMKENCLRNLQEVLPGKFTLGLGHPKILGS